MFTGIIEQLGIVTQLKEEGTNLHIEVEADFTSELQVDQSVAHNGVCLTVVSLTDKKYVVTAIQETLEKTNLAKLTVGSKVNLERCMQMNGRLDGHIVQGHVDQTAEVIEIKEEDGSWIFTFSYDSTLGNVTVEKGSVTVNGTSLTVVNSIEGQFSVAIIPYTYEHTVFHTFNVGDQVNLEFDIIGKYVARYFNQIKGNYQ